MLFFNTDLAKCILDVSDRQFLFCKDVDEDEVEEEIDEDCTLKANIQLKVPIYTKAQHSRQHHGRLSPAGRIPSPSNPMITSIELKSLTRDQFQFDVTWFTETFHLLDELWNRESEILRQLLPKLIRRSFRHAIQHVNTDDWIKNKFQLFQEQIRTAETQRNSTLKRHWKPKQRPDNYFPLASSCLSRKKVVKSGFKLITGYCHYYYRMPQTKNGGFNPSSEWKYILTMAPWLKVVFLSKIWLLLQSLGH